MTRREFVIKATDCLTDNYSPGEAKAIAIRILSHFLGLSEYEYSVEPNMPVPKSDLDKLHGALAELTADRPVQYVLGEETFAGRKYKVSESVLIPRPETEQLCRLIIDDCRQNRMSTPKILDACTGSGCIAYTLAAAFPNAEVFALDAYQDALTVARSQKITIDEEGKCELKKQPVFFQADLLAEPSDAPVTLEDFDILVSNPPYVCESEKDFMDANVLEYEPETALFVPDSDPLRFYKALANWAGTIMKPGGRCWFEINEAFGKQVAELYEQRGFTGVEIIKDFRDRDRFVRFEVWL